MEQNITAKLLARAGRLTLINAFLTATATYFLTVFAPSKWTTKRMDKMRRNFLWNVNEEAKGRRLRYVPFFCSSKVAEFK
jgi:hypothetical protein